MNEQLEDLQLQLIKGNLTKAKQLIDNCENEELTNKMKNIYFNFIDCQNEVIF